MRRRIFLSGALSAATLAALAACTPPAPTPTSTVTPGPVPTPTTTAVPKPSAFARSAWSSDPYALGSVSYLPAGATPQHRIDLAENVSDRVFFAGEATASTNPGTVQGALASGIRVAGDVSAVAADGEKVAVIGAGIAGATAARRLADAGFEVTILEARERVGGRIDTRAQDDGAAPFELGAPGYGSAATSSLAAALAGAGVSTRGYDRTAALVLDQEGAEAQFAEAGADAVVRATAWAATEALDLPLGESLAGSGAPDPASAEPGGSVTDEDRVAGFLGNDLAVRFGASTELSSWYGVAEGGTASGALPGIDEQPSDGGDEETTAPTDDAGDGSDPAQDTADTLVTGGFATLVESTIEGLELLLRAAVSAISYDEQGASVRLTTGESLSVDRVVVTVPLGVLKTDAIAFDPPLPFPHRTAIGALGSGVVDTVWMRFETPFWQTTAQRWSLVDSGELLTEWINLQPITGEAVLVGLVGSDAALALEQLSDDEVIASAMVSLGPFATAVDPEGS